MKTWPLLFIVLLSCKAEPVRKQTLTPMAFTEEPLAGENDFSFTLCGQEVVKFKEDGTVELYGEVTEDSEAVVEALKVWSSQTCLTPEASSGG